MKHDASMAGVRWAVLLFVGILVGGTAVVLKRRFDIDHAWLDAVVGASVLTILVSFIGFMARLRE